MVISFRRFIYYSIEEMVNTYRLTKKRVADIAKIIKPNNKDHRLSAYREEMGDCQREEMDRLCYGGLSKGITEVGSDRAK